MSIATLVAGSPIGVGTANSEATKAVQAKLGLAQSGLFDDATRAAVEALQHHYNLDKQGLTAFGMVGQMTARLLDALPTVQSPATAAAMAPTAVHVQSRGDLGSWPIWTQWKIHELGVHEVGNNGGPDIERYIRLAGGGKVGWPWCAIFENASLEVNGIRGTRSASSQSFRTDPNFVKLAGPAIGAITVMWRESLHSGLGHVGDYLGETATHVLILSGNEGDAVKKELLPKAAATFGVVGYYWPKAVPLPVIGPVPILAGAPIAQVKVV